VLIRGNADLEARGGDGCTAMNAAVWAATNDDAADSLITLLDAGADPNSGTADNSERRPAQPIRITSQIIQPPLSQAAHSGNIRAASLLLLRGASPNRMDGLGDTPLHTVSGSISPANDKVTRMLIEAGGDVNARGFLGATPLLAAARQGNLGAARILLEAGADPSVASDQGVGAAGAACDCAETGEAFDLWVCPLGGCEHAGTREAMVRLLSG
ncbi:unnamed protein product, partial [Ostreobium quekettii]